MGNTGPQGPAGQALAARSFVCANGQIAAGQAALNFINPGGFEGSFGSSIATPGTPPFSSFTLQAGTYQIHLDGYGFVPAVANNLPFIDLSLNSQLSNFPIFWATALMPGDTTGTSRILIGGDRLLAVPSDGSTLQVIVSPAQTASEGACELVITRLQ
jgi:hypothetical protein